MASHDPRPENLVLSHPVYNEFELDTRDEFYDVPRGGQPLADDEFYMMSRQVRSHSGSFMEHHSHSVLIRGFDITLRELWAVDNAMKRECVDTDLVRHFEFRTPKHRSLVWAIRVRLIKRSGVLKQLFNHKIYGWWAADAFTSWFLASRRALLKNPALATNCIDSIRHFDLAIDLARPNNLQRPGLHEKYRLKDCFLKFSDPIGNVKYIPFTAFMTRESPDGTDLYLGTTDISLLYQPPETPFGICDSSYYVIKYTKRSTIGFIDDKTVITSEDLRSAIMDLWKDGQQVFELRIVKRETQVKEEAREVDADAAFVSTKKAKKAHGDGRGSKKRKASSA